MSARDVQIVERRPAGPDAQVITLTAPAGEVHDHCRVPCPGCPWRRSNDGSFPAEAFAHSAETSHDMSRTVFGCHEAGADPTPRTCAGFLLSIGAEHNLAIRLAILQGRFAWVQVDAAGADLHPNYVSMASANGMTPTDSRLRGCR